MFFEAWLHQNPSSKPTVRPRSVVLRSWTDLTLCEARLLSRRTRIHSDLWVMSGKVYSSDYSGIAFLNYISVQIRSICSGLFGVSKFLRVRSLRGQSPGWTGWRKIVATVAGRRDVRAGASFQEMGCRYIHRELNSANNDFLPFSPSRRFHCYLQVACETFCLDDDETLLEVELSLGSEALSNSTVRFVEADPQPIAKGFFNSW